MLGPSGWLVWLIWGGLSGVRGLARVRARRALHARQHAARDGQWPRPAAETQRADVRALAAVDEDIRPFGDRVRSVGNRAGRDGQVLTRGHAREGETARFVGAGADPGALDGDQHGPS